MTSELQRKRAVTPPPNPPNKAGIWNFWGGKLFGPYATKDEEKQDGFIVPNHNGEEKCST